MANEIISLFTGEDWIDSEKINDRTAQLKCIPLNPEYGLDDIVLYDKETKNILQIVKKHSNTFFIQFHSNRKTLFKNVFKQLQTFLSTKNIVSELFQDGLAGLSTPLELTREELQLLLTESAVECTIIDPEPEEDGEEDEEDMW